MKYSSLEQRLAQSYIDMLPSFVPDENAPVSVSEQKHFYDLIMGLFQLAFNEPLYFVTSLHEDDAFLSRHKNAKPQLNKDMKKFTKSMNGLLKAMYLLGQGEEVKLDKKQLSVLSKIGIDDLTNLPVAWKWMTTKKDPNPSIFTNSQLHKNYPYVSFSHCLFNDNYPYTSDIYSRLLGESAFEKLENWMLSQGYKLYNVYNIIASDCNLSLSIINQKWSGEPPYGGCEYKVKHTGISAQFDDYLETPASFGLLIPNGMKEYLNDFDSMDRELQTFVFERTKKCDKCKYCVATDKAGTRPLSHTIVNFEGDEYKLCNLIPGYNFCWTSIDDSLADMLIKMLSFMDRFIPEKV